MPNVPTQTLTAATLAVVAVLGAAVAVGSHQSLTAAALAVPAATDAAGLTETTRARGTRPTPAAIAAGRSMDEMIPRRGQRADMEAVAFADPRAIEDAAATRTRR